jgi:hypothetical protein
MKTRFPDMTARAAAAGNREGRSGPHRIAAGDRRLETGGCREKAGQGFICRTNLISAELPSS